MAGPDEKKKDDKGVKEGDKSNLPAKISTNVPGFLEDPKFIEEMKAGETRISVCAKLTVNDKPVVVNTGDISKGKFVFYLTEPVRIGTPKDFIEWFYSKFKYKLPDPSEAKLPDIIEKPIKSFMNGQVTLDSLVIDQEQRLYHFGMSLDLVKDAKGEGGPIPLIGGITFDGLGLMITRKGEEEKEKEKEKKK